MSSLFTFSGYPLFRGLTVAAQWARSHKTTAIAAAGAALAVSSHMYSRFNSSETTHPINGASLAPEDIYTMALPYLGQAAKVAVLSTLAFLTPTAAHRSLEWAICHKKTDFALMLIKLLSANILAKTNKDGVTLFNLAIYHEVSLDVIKALIEKSSQYAFPALLHLSISRKVSPDIIKALIEKSPQDAFTIRNEDGDTALYSAIKHEIDPKIIITLIEKSPLYILTIQTEDGCTPLHLAIFREVSLDVIKALIEKSPISVLTIQDTLNGDTPLHLALSSKRGYPDIIKVLIKKSSQDAFSIQNKNGQTPLHVSFIHHKENPDIIKALIEKSPPDALAISDNIWGFTPLHSAIGFRADPKITMALIEKSPLNTFFMEDADKRTPLDVAQQREMTEVVKAIRTKMAQRLAEATNLPQDVGFVITSMLEKTS